MIRHLFLLLFLSVSAFAKSIPVVDLTEGKSVVVNNLVVVTEGEREDFSAQEVVWKVLKKNYGHLVGPQLNLPEDKSYWILFEIKNSSSSNSIFLHDSLHILQNQLIELSLLKGSYPDKSYMPDTIKVVNSIFSKDYKDSGSNKISINIPPLSCRIIAMKIRPNYCSFKGVLRIGISKINVNFTQILEWIISSTNLFTWYFLIWIIITLYLFRWNSVLLYLFLSVFFAISGIIFKYTRNLGMLDSISKDFVMSILNAAQYTSFIQLVYAFCDMSRINKWVFRIIDILRYSLWVSAASYLVTTFTHYEFYKHWSLIVHMLIVLIFILIKIYNFYSEPKDKSCAYFIIAFLPLLFILLQKVIGIFYVSFLDLLPNYLDKVFVIIPYFLFGMIVIYNEHKSLSIDDAISKNSDRVFKSLRDFCSLKDVLSRLFIYFNQDVKFDSLQLYIKNASGYHFYMSIPNKTLDMGISSMLDLFKKLPKGEMFSSGDVRKDPMFQRYILDKFYSSIIVLPLELNKRRLGYLVFLSSKYNQYSTRDRIVAKDLAYKVSVLLENHRQMEIMHSYTKKSQIEESIREFHRNTTHDIKAPLMGIKTAISVVVKKLKDKKSILPLFKQMDEAVNLALDQIHESMSMVAEKDEEFTIEYLSSQLSDLKKIGELEGIEFVERNSFESYFPVIGPKKAIKNIFRSIVKNSVEALEKSNKQEKKIEISYSKQKGKFCIKIEDNGTGIKSEHKKKIFDTFSHGKEGGSGQGLVLAKSIAERLGGTIEVDSMENKYTIVKIILDIL